MDRVILHSDLNNFYASVECALNPALRGFPMAVGGNEKDRHGVVLAKNEQAKKFGVKTAMPLFSARRLCPDLVIVPPHFDLYLSYSRKAKEIYKRYTDQIESFGIDECWLDVTGSLRAFGCGKQIAEQIRSAVKQELQVTVSIGISYNKVFAKLGSDLKKPDAVSCIGRYNFRDILWPLPVSSLLGVGERTRKKLEKYGIYSIKDLTRTDPDILSSMLGVNGLTLHHHANGLDTSIVRHMSDKPPAKSVSHGVTCSRDLTAAREVQLVILDLSQAVSRRLRQAGLLCAGIQVSIKNCKFFTQDFQMLLNYQTQSAQEIAKAAFSLFQERYDWESPVRAVAVRAFHLADEQSPRQVGLFSSQENKISKIEIAVEEIRDRFGNNAIRPASLLTDYAVPHADEDARYILPAFTNDIDDCMDR